MEYRFTLDAEACWTSEDLQEILDRPVTYYGSERYGVEWSESWLKLRSLLTDVGAKPKSVKKYNSRVG